MVNEGFHLGACLRVQISKYIEHVSACLELRTILGGAARQILSL